MSDVVRVPEVVQEYPADRLFAKLGRFARVAGRILVERALRLYYAARDPATPAWAKRAIYAALAYFVLPFDAVPDFIPGIGYLDDLSTITFTLLLVSVYVSAEVKARARAKTAEWFG